MKRLAVLRKEKGLSQVELSNILGMSQQSISKYENATREPDNKTLIKIAEFFDVTVDYLIGKSNVRKPSDSDYFKSVDEAVEYIIEDGALFGGAGVDINQLTDDEKIELANDIRNQVKMVGYKYRK